MRGKLRYMTGCIVCSVLLASVGAWTLGANQQSKPDELSNLTTAAISTDADTANGAIAALRSSGPAGLAALMSAYGNDINAHRMHPNNSAEPQRWGRISAALDAVAKQRDAWASGLYWYTDLPAAEAAAKASGKPILSLHLLGQLDQELSCANSRFFRVTLYPNSDVNAVLRNNFVLHWKSERPAPTITVDFGDGRKIVRTITGNSVHYIIDADGRVIDAIPGLYGAQPFIRRLHEAETIELALRQGDSEKERDAKLEDWHHAQIAAIDSACAADLRSLHLTSVPAADDLNGWRQLGNLHINDFQFDTEVTAMILEKNPDALRAGGRAIGKGRVENPLVKAVRNIESMVADDCIRNDYLLHRQIHQWLASGQGKAGLDRFNNMVYAELFLTPASDPWLGLAPPDAFSALDHDGLLQSADAKQ